MSATWPRRGPRWADPRGFTLIELLATLVILSTGIVLVLRAFQTALGALIEARDQLRAASLIGRVASDAELRLRSGGGLDVAVERWSQPPYRGFRSTCRVRTAPAARGTFSAAAARELYEIEVVVTKDGARWQVSAVTRCPRPAEGG